MLGQGARGAGEAALELIEPPIDLDRVLALAAELVDLVE
jgi:hypothetical protein